jgi:hypothetical protein
MEKTREEIKTFFEGSAHELAVDQEGHCIYLSGFAYTQSLFSFLSAPQVLLP